MAAHIVKAVETKAAAATTEAPVTSLDDSKPVTRVVKFITSDKKEYVVEYDIVSMSKLVTTALESDPNGVIELKEVASGVMDKIIVYLTHHKGVVPEAIVTPITSDKMSEICKDAFDAKYIDDIATDEKYLAILLSAAHYMDIEPLIHLGCTKFATLIKLPDVIVPVDDDDTKTSESEASDDEKESKEEEKSDESEDDDAEGDDAEGDDAEGDAEVAEEPVAADEEEPVADEPAVADEEPEAGDADEVAIAEAAADGIEEVD